MSMRAIFGALKEFNDDAMLMAKQLGTDGIHFNTPPIPGEKTWEADALQYLIDYSQKFGLKVEMIENVPIRFYDKVLLGLPGRDEQIDNYINIIRNMGKVGIPLFGHHFCPNWAWRTTLSEKGRGGANVAAYDKSREANGNAYIYPYITDGEFPTHEQLWDNYTYFIKAIVPEAEKAGVRVLIHPSDPPLPFVDGKARIFTSLDDFKKGEQIADSPAWGVNLCLGCFSQIGGEEHVLETIRYLGEKKLIGFVHLRDVQGTGECFKECFLGEGNYNPAKVLWALKDAGYDGCIMDDHVPYIVNHTRWGHTARANANGYIQGMLKMMDYAEERHG